MSGFSFSTKDLGSSQSVGKSLEGNKIHEVKFLGANIHEFPNKQGGDAYEVIQFKFVGANEAPFEHSIFAPRPQDFDRGESVFLKDGKENKVPNPSNVESMMLFFKHTIDAILPEVAEKLDNGDIVLQGKTWNELRKNVVEMLAPGIGVTTSIKLIKDKNGFARFPGYFTSLNTKTGKAYVKNNFIGKDLGFTPAEVTRMKKETTAKPTEMSFDDTAVVDDDMGSLDMDFSVGAL